ncbi:MAG: hypothetical protein AB7G21_10940 [Dehalococcoidia bacterium]
MRTLATLAAAASLLAVTACSSQPEAPAATGTATTAAPAATTAAAAGSPAASKIGLDAAFGKDGVAKVALAGTGNQRFMATAPGPDGKIYAAGFVSLSGGDTAMALARLDAKGALDKSFGKDGVASVNVAIGGKSVEVARGIAVQSSGKIVITGPVEHDVAATGDAAKDTDVAVVRFAADGKVDTTFGKGGVAVIDVGTGKAVGTSFVSDSVWGIGSLPGDKLVLMTNTLATGAGRSDADFALVGLTSAGALDTAFGTDGKVVVDLGASLDNARHLVVQPDGKILGTGYSNIGGVVQPVLIRTNSAGVLDKEFGKDGVATAKVLDGVAESYSVRQQGSDYIMAGYGRGADSKEKVDMIVYRFKGNGTWDTAFGEKGVYRLDIAKEDDRARNVLVLSDGRIVAAGSGKKTAANIDGMVVLLSKDGQPEKAFGENGVLITDLGGPADAWFGIALSADGKHVILAGYKGADATSGGNDEAVLGRINLS